jgi:hypothetical protein
VRGGPLQRDPDPEEPEAPLVEPGVPNRSFLVAPVVDGAVPPLPAGRRERSVPRRPRRLTRSPGCGSVTPRGPVEITTLRIPVPTAGTTGSAGAARTVRVEVPGSTGPARAVVLGTTGSTGPARVVGSARAVVLGTTGSTGSARVVGSGRAWTAWSAWAGSAGTARVTWSARTGTAGATGRVRRRRAMAAGRSPRRSWGGVCRTGAHTDRRRAKSTSDSSRRKQLLEFHSPHLCNSECLEHSSPIAPTLDSLPMDQL